jgi:hypothetical protein
VHCWQMEGKGIGRLKGLRHTGEVVWVVEVCGVHDDKLVAHSIKVDVERETV